MKVLRTDTFLASSTALPSLFNFCHSASLFRAVRWRRRGAQQGSRLTAPSQAEAKLVHYSQSTDYRLPAWRRLPTPKW